MNSGSFQGKHVGTKLTASDLPLRGCLNRNAVLRGDPSGLEPPLHGLGAKPAGVSDSRLAAKDQKYAIKGSVHAAHCNPDGYHVVNVTGSMAQQAVSADHLPMVKQCVDSYGDRIEYIRKACNYPTKASFADAVGVRPQALTHWAGPRGLSREGAMKIAAATGASLDYLLRGVGAPFSGPRILYDGKGSDQAVQGLRARLAAVEFALSGVAAVLTAKRPDGAEAFRDYLQTDEGRELESPFLDDLVRLISEGLPVPAGVPKTRKT